VSFPNLIHNAPSADPVAFTAALFGFLAKTSGESDLGRRGAAAHEHNVLLPFKIDLRHG
jgi:hypothetical protein